MTRVFENRPEGATTPTGWPSIPLKYLFRRSKTLGTGEERLLSIYRDYGVIPKDSRDDNFNKPSDDLSKYQVVSQGDLVVNKMKAWQGSVAVSEYDGIISPAYFVYRPMGVIDGRFAHYLLRSNEYFQYYASISSGVRPNQWDLDPRAFERLEVTIPSHEEQHAIADYLDRETAEIDAFLHDQNLLIELLRERRLAQLAREVSGSDSGLAKHDVPWAPGLKTLFPTVNIRRVAEMRTGHTPNRNKPEYWLETHIPWFTLADVWQIRAGGKFLGETTEMISSLGLANSAADLLPAGTVVLSRTASVGFTGIMPHPMATSQDYWNWVCGPDILPEYLWFQFRAMRPEFDRIKSGSTHKTIYKADAAAITLVLPPLEDQQEIVQRLTAVDEELAAAEEDVLASIQLAQERRSALISAAVTGQIDVTVQGVSAVERLRDELEVHV